MKPDTCAWKRGERICLQLGFVGTVLELEIDGNDVLALFRALIEKFEGADGEEDANMRGQMVEIYRALSESLIKRPKQSTEVPPWAATANVLS